MRPVGPTAMAVLFLKLKKLTQTHHRNTMTLVYYIISMVQDDNIVSYKYWQDSVRVIIAAVSVLVVSIILVS